MQIYAIGLLVYVPQTPPTTYITLTLRNLGFNAVCSSSLVVRECGICSPDHPIKLTRSQFNTNLLTVPATAAQIPTLIGLTWLSIKLNERSFVSMIQDIWSLACLLALRFWAGSGIDAWPTYALVTVLLSYPYCHAIVVAWTSENSGSVRNRSVSAAVYNVTVQCGNVISANIYRTNDAPMYHHGNVIMIMITIIAILLFVFAKVYYVSRKRSRSKKWDAMTEEEKEGYIKNTTDEGNKRLDFRFAH